MPDIPILVSITLSIQVAIVVAIVVVMANVSGSMTPVHSEYLTKLLPETAGMHVVICCERAGMAL
jgi:hypothetical protein